MTLSLAFFLGVLQWITEFLPVSSSGHLAIFEIFFWDINLINQMLSFDIILHSWSFVALIIYFRKTLVNIILWIFSNNSKSKKLFFMLIIASIPAIIFWWLLWNYVEQYSHSIIFLSFTFFISAIYFLFSENRSINTRTHCSVWYKQSLIIWLSQALAVLPWISRSWTTLATWLLIWINRKEAIDFSFLMWIPIIFAACSYMILKSWNGILNTFNLMQIIIWFLTSMLCSIFTIHFLIKFFQKYTLKWFSIYLFSLSIFLNLLTYLL